MSTLPTCVLTVCSLTTIRPAIWALDNPRASRCSVSCSRAVRASAGPGAGAAYRSALGTRLGRTLRHLTAASQLSRVPRVMDAAVAAAGSSQAVFDDVVRLGLADGLLSGRALTAAARSLR